jgi:hypothetical protein
VQQYERLHGSDAFDNIADEDGYDEDTDDMNDSDDGIKGLFNFSSTSAVVQDIDGCGQVNPALSLSSSQVKQLAIGTLAAKTYRSMDKRQSIPTNRLGQRHGASAAHVIITSNKSLLGVQLDSVSRQKRLTDEAGVSSVVSTIITPHVIIPVGDVPAHHVTDNVPIDLLSNKVQVCKGIVVIDDEEDNPISQHLDVGQLQHHDVLLQTTISHYNDEADSLQR